MSLSTDLICKSNLKGESKVIYMSYNMKKRGKAVLTSAEYNQYAADKMLYKSSL